MDIESLQHPVVKAAISAMQRGDRQAWLDLFATNAVFTDDGQRQDLVRWSDRELFGASTGQLTSVDRQKDGGLSLIGSFRSDRWGEFKTFLRFHVQDGKITRLDVGQLNE